MALNCPQSLDDVFGPSVNRCRRNFDFTLLFEQSILSIPPSVICILLALWRMWQLLGRNQRVRGQWLPASKLICCIILVALNLTLVSLWSTTATGRTKASIPSASLSLIVALLLGPLSCLENRNSIRPSPVLSSYLILSILLDLAQVRTLWLMHVRTSIAAVFSTSFSIRCILLVFESVDKNRFLIHTEDINKTPEDKSGIVSLSLYLWMNGLIHFGFRKALTLKDLYTTSTDISAEKLEIILTNAWTQAPPRRKHRLLIATTFALKSHLLAAILPRLCMIAFTVCQPLLMLRLIHFLNERPASLNVGYGLLGAYAIVYLGIAISTSWFWYQHFKLVAAVRASLVALIYGRSLTLSLAAIDKGSSVTIMSADVERIIFGLRYIHEIWANVIQVALSAWLLEIQTGPAVAAPLFVAVVCAFITIKIGALAGPRQGEWLTSIQKRIGVTSATLSAMRGVKISGLTQKLLDIVQGLRITELSTASKFRRWIVAAAVLGYISQLISPVLTFAIFIAIANSQNLVLDTATMFTSLSFLMLISAPLNIVFQSVPGFMSTIVCFGRIEKFIDTEKWSNDARQPPGSENSLPEKVSSTDAIEISSGTYGWAKDGKPVLENVNLKIPRGKLTFVIGRVGCGKSTLLKALLGEVPLAEGNINNPLEGVAFCDQTPWILNGTFKENVCMFSNKQDPYYDTVLHACGLHDDLKQLPDGDRSSLGSKGITLSGGQKQRLSLARLIFARRNVNLCDDPLSGLDSTTEMHVFSHVFGPSGLLRKNGVTAIISTHAVRLLPYADYVVCIGSGGQIAEHGTFSDLKSRAGYVSRLNIADKLSLPDLKADSRSSGSNVSVKTKEEFIEKEVEVAEHTKPTGVYRFYSNAVGLTPSIIYLLLAMIYAFLTNFPYIWTKWWAEDNERNPGSRQAYYMGIYAMFQTLCLISFGLTAWHGIITVVSFGGRSLHWSLLSTALNAPLSFFDKTDTGTTLNRFSQDMQLIDGELPQSLFQVLTLSFTLIGQFLLIMNASYWLAISFPAIGVFMWALQKVYLRTSRRLRHMELETKSPLYTQFLESIDGLATMRAYAWQPDFLGLYHQRLDDSQRPFYLLMCLQRWLALVLDMFSAGFVVLIVGLVVGLRDKISPGFAGVALSNMINLSQLMSHLVTTWTALETSVASVERIRAFQKETPSEAAENVQEPPPNWPEKGAVEIRGIEATYRDGATKALRNLTMDIKPSEKIGICGRTGSGKTSLMLALFRMISISSGTIHIDGVDISTIPPNSLRSALNAIPQEPYFYSGTIKENADPNGIKTEDDIWRAIEAVHLKNVIEGKGGLEVEMKDDTLSHGEKQLFCLARAILKNCKVVVLDEATSNIDIETDKLIQNTIREQFADCTVITIAHRLENILGSDRIAVLDHGEIIEFDTPSALLGWESRFKEFYDAHKREESNKLHD